MLKMTIRLKHIPGSKMTIFNNCVVNNLQCIFSLFRLFSEQVESIHICLFDFYYSNSTEEKRWTLMWTWRLRCLGYPRGQDLAEERRDPRPSVPTGHIMRGHIMKGHIISLFTWEIWTRKLSGDWLHWICMWKTFLLHVMMGSRLSRPPM